MADAPLAALFGTRWRNRRNRDIFAVVETTPAIVLHRIERSGWDHIEADEYGIWRVASVQALRDEFEHVRTGWVATPDPLVERG